MTKSTNIPKAREHLDVALRQIQAYEDFLMASNVPISLLDAFIEHVDASRKDIKMALSMMTRGFVKKKVFTGKRITQREREFVRQFLLSGGDEGMTEVEVSEYCFKSPQYAGRVSEIRRALA